MKLESVMCLPAILVDGAMNEQAYMPYSNDLATLLFQPQNVWFAPRAYIEDNENYRQLIPYNVLYKGDKIAVYKRTDASGEKRLVGRGSIGFGGHINLSDVRLIEDGVVEVMSTIKNAIKREVNEEIHFSSMSGVYANSKPIGFMSDLLDPVGRVHVGLVTVREIQPDVEVKAMEDALKEIAWLTEEEFYDQEDTLERWSQIAGPHVFEYISNLKGKANAA